jgi:hypothetical protein
MVIRGIIDRRILVNYRVEPDVVAGMLPPGMLPKLAHGYAIAGICLIRLKSIRPSFLPAVLGLGSENAAHRIAVEWQEHGGWREGVYIPRRDTNSVLSPLVGGRLFRGVHHRARFDVAETPERLSIQIASRDGATRVCVVGHVTAGLPAGSIFTSLAEASSFFQSGSLGYSPDASGARLQGLELRCQSWSLEPLELEQVESSFFNDPERFPSGAVQFDCALLMRGTEHEWHSRGELCCDSSAQGTGRSIEARVSWGAVYGNQFQQLFRCGA